MDLIRLALAGGLVALDTTAAFQVMISQPLIGGLLTGWALHDPWLGAFIGLLFQGLYMAELPIGARIFPDGNLGTVQAAALTIFLRNEAGATLGVSLILGFFWAIPASIIGGQVIVWMRRLHGLYLPSIDHLVTSGRQGMINLLYAAVILENFLFGALQTIVLYLLGTTILPRLTTVLPGGDLLSEWGMALRGSLLGAGCAVIFSILMGKIQGFKRWLILISAGIMAGIWLVGY